jgi:hypothetical protein
MRGQRRRVRDCMEANRMPLNYSAGLGPVDKIKNDLALRVRRQIFNLFMRELGPAPDDCVADFGVSGHREHPAHYFFESLYPYKHNLTAIGQAAEGANWLPDAFPGLNFLEADLNDIPLPDNYFDVGLCNAVVEHAGTREQQAHMVREICRVCRRVMFTTPNKSFPVELHTFLPLVHWLPDCQFRTILRGLGFSGLASIDVLNPLHAEEFMCLFPHERNNRLLKIGALPVSTNLICISTANPAR